MGDGQGGTGYRVTFSQGAIADLRKLAPPVRKRVAAKIDWLSENAEQIRHEQLKHMPEHLRGLCKYRVGEYRVLYWLYQDRQELWVYGVIHRRTDYARVHKR